MDAFKKATKRITAVAASAALVSSAVFGAGLSSYPGNFGVSKFQGQVVIGSDADAAAATSIIDDLAAELSGDEDKVMITYSMGAVGSDLDVMESKKTELNMGDTLNAVLTDSVTESDEKTFLADGDVKNKEYTQKMDLSTVDGSLDLVYDKSLSSDAVAGIKLTKTSGVLAKYELEFTDSLGDLSSSTDMDVYKGESIEIMGNSYTIKSVSDSKLVLLGGANEVSLGEGESTSVSIDGVSYDVEVLGVGTDSVMVSVNGEVVTVDEFDSEDVAGTSVIATEVFSNDRNGYATVIIGGSEIEMTNGEVRVTEDGDLTDISDVHEGYMVQSVLSNTSGKLKVVLEWSVDDDMLIEEGGSINDVLFGAFSLNLGERSDGGNWVDVEVSASSEEASLTVGDQVLGDIWDWTTGTNVVLMGDDEDNDFLYDGSAVVLNMEDADAVGTRFISGTSDVEDAEVYEIVKISESDNDYELTIKVLSDGDREFTVDATDLDSEIDLGNSDITVSDVFNTSAETEVYGLAVNDTTSGDKLQYLTFTAGATGNIVEYDNNLRVTLTDNTFSVKLDGADIDSSDGTETTIATNDQVNISLAYDNGTDEQIELSPAFNAGWTIQRKSESSDDKDNKIGLSRWGSTVAYESGSETQSVMMSVPDEEVSYGISYSTGTSATSMSMTVAAADADAKVAELEADGYTVSTKAVEANAVEFDVTAPVMADEVEGSSDMIVVGGPAVNAAAAELLGLSFPTYGEASGVMEGEAVVRFFEDENSVLVYGWDAAATVAAANKLNAGGLTGSEVNVQ